jgi:lipid A 3-O-deacylase
VRNLKSSLFSIGVLAVLGLLLIATRSEAGTAGGVYDMTRMLNQPHPFANAQSSPRPNFGGRTIRPPANPQSDAPPPSVRIPAKPIQYNTPSSNSAKGILSEIRVGALWHDQGPFSHRKEEGSDGNLEILFTSPDILKAIWSPRPHVGLSVNSGDDTNQAYLGLTWEYGFSGNFFVNGSLGGAYHDGSKVTDRRDKKSLCYSILFRESVDVGYRFTGAHALMLHIDHISNAKLCSTNEGLESVGIRYGYHF